MTFLSKPRHLVLAGVTALSFGSLCTLFWWYKKPILRMLFRSSYRDRRRRKKNGVNVGAIFGMDVGGTLTKIVYFRARQSPPGKEGSDPLTFKKRKSSESLAQLDSPDHKAALEEVYSYMDTTSQKSNGVLTRDADLTVYSPFLDGELHFLHFETRNVITAINVLSSTAVMEHIKSLGCTGGGAHKYAKQIFEELEITLNKFDELGCLVRGMHFALTNFSDECYTYRNADAPLKTSEEHVSSDNENNESTSPQDGDKEVPISVKRWQKDSKQYTKKVFLPYPSLASFPYLVVNIGSGVSILKVSSPGQYERVSGTSLGGGTYWGLCRLLTNCATYDEVLDIAENGDAGTVDMLVRDIYGGDYGGLLSGSMVASSFGKLVMKERPREGVREEDLALALLMMITNNIGQIAHLIAQLHQCQKIFFVGSFLRHNPISCRRLAFAIEFWSAGSMEALFLTHEGYYGALGTFLQSAYGDDVDRILKHPNRAAVKVKKDLSLDATKLGVDSGDQDSNRGSPNESGWSQQLASWSRSLGHRTLDVNNSAKSEGEGERIRNQRRPRSSSEDIGKAKYLGSISPR